MVVVATTVEATKVASVVVIKAVTVVATKAVTEVVIKVVNLASMEVIKEEEAATTAAAEEDTISKTNSRIRAKTTSSKLEVVVVATTEVATREDTSPVVDIRADLIPAMKVAMVTNHIREAAEEGPVDITTSAAATDRSTVHPQGNNSGSSLRANKLRLRRPVVPFEVDSPNCESV